MIAEAAKPLSPLGTVFLQTIDTDIILQMLVSRGIYPTSRVWLRLMNGRSRPGLVGLYGGESIEQRLTACFFLLCCNGVDYTCGLGGYGFYITGLSSLAHSPPVFSVTGDTATLHTYDMVSRLCTIRQRNVRKKTWQGFNDEIHNILFCISLFSGACRTREPAGGPDLTEGSLVQAPTDAYSVKQLAQIDPSGCTDITIQIGGDPAATPGPE